MQPLLTCMALELSIEARRRDLVAGAIAECTLCILCMAALVLLSPLPLLPPHSLSCGRIYFVFMLPPMVLSQFTVAIGTLNMDLHQIQIVAQLPTIACALFTALVSSKTGEYAATGVAIAVLFVASRNLARHQHLAALGLVRHLERLRVTALARQ